MKRIAFYSLSILLLCSCAKELSPITENKVEGEEKFELAIDGQIDQVFATRANDNGFCNGDAVGMFMVNYESGVAGVLKAEGNQADNAKFTYQESTNKWNPIVPVYYKDGKTNVDIYGYYPYDGSISDVEAYSFEVRQNQRSEVRNGSLGGYEASDFLWGKSENITPSNNIVDILFKHRMSSIRIALTKGEGWESDSEWQAVSKDVIVNNTVRKAEINLSDGSVTAAGEAPETGIVPAENGSDMWRAVVVPQEVAAGKAVLTITIDGRARTLVKDAAYTYYPGKMNIITLAVNKDADANGVGLSIVSEGVVAWENDGVSHDEASREYIVINCPGAGKLAETIAAEGYDLTKIRNLKVEGKIDKRDFDTMRDAMTVLESLNLQNVKILEFGYIEDKIPDYAFIYKTSLKRVILPSSIIAIGDYSFLGTSLSGSLLLPEGLETIGHGAFSGLSDLDGTLSLPNSLTIIGDEAFRDCNFRGNLILPEGLTYIGWCAFDNNDFSGHLILPSGLREIGRYAFQSNRKLSGNLVIPDKIEVIGVQTFYGCGFDGYLKLGKSVKKIDDNAFIGNPFSGALVLPESVTNIGAHAFYSCGFSSVSFTDNIVSIADGAFEGNSNLSGEIKLPANLETIGKGAFSCCSNIEKLVLPKSLIYIGGGAFSGLFNIQSIVCESTEVPELAQSAFDGIPMDNFALEVPETAVKDYQNARGWNEFKRIVAHQEFSISRRLFRTLNKAETRTFTLRAESGAAWSVASKPDWVNVSPMSGTGKIEVTVTVSSLAKGAGNREGEIVYSLDGKNYTASTKVEQYDYQYGDGDVYTVQTHSKGKGVHLVFMGDCYDAKDISEGQYLTNLQEAIEYFFAIEPYNTYRDYFDVHIVFGCSEDSGIGDLNIIREAKFGSQYVVGADIEPDFNICFTYASKAPISRLSESLVVLVLNSNNYAGVTYMYGDGSALAVLPMSTREYPFDFRGLVQHEAGGHGFGKLGDEYIYYNTFLQGDPFRYNKFVSAKALGWYDNMSLTGDLVRVPWSHLIYDPKYSNMVDIYEGGYFFARGVYRSEANSCMNNNVPYFSTISRESIVKRIMKYAGEKYSFEKFKSLDVSDDSAAIVTKSGGPREVPDYYDIGRHREPVMMGESPVINPER